MEYLVFKICGDKETYKETLKAIFFSRTDAEEYAEEFIQGDYTTFAIRRVEQEK